jgi:hypothetical protein
VVNVIFFHEEECSRAVEDVIKAYKCRQSEERISVLRLELDYELALLFDAMIENSVHQMDQCKERLREIRKEMLALEAF